MLSYLFSVCAVVGGTLYVCQFLLSLWSFDHRGLFGGHQSHGGGTAASHHRIGTSGLRHGGASHGAVRHAAAHHHGVSQHTVVAHHGHTSKAGQIRRSIEHMHISWLAGVLSVESIIPGLTVFGLVGLAINATGVLPVLAVAGAVGGGFLTMLVAAALMRTMTNLGDEGTIHLERAVGKVATVYLTIPNSNTGKGKVTVTVQNRTMEFPAITYEDADLPTGSKVVVAAVHELGIVEVVSANKVLPEQGI